MTKIRNQNTHKTFKKEISVMIRNVVPPKCENLFSFNFTTLINLR